MQVQKKEFLTLEEREQLQKEIDRIKTKLKKMPTRTTYLLSECLESSTPHHLRDIDADGQLLLELLNEQNSKEFHRQFQQISKAIFQIIEHSEAQYEVQGSLMFLKDQINETVNKAMGGNEFDLRLAEMNISGDSLWERLHGSTAQIITGIYGFMIKYYQIAQSEEIQIRKVQEQMDQFRDGRKEVRKKLSKIYRMAEDKHVEKQQKGEEESFLDKMNESKVQITLSGEEQNLNSILKMIQMQEQEQQQFEAKDAHQQKINGTQKDKSGGFLSFVKRKSVGVIKTIGGYIKSNQPYEQKSLSGVESSKLQSFLTNLQHHFQLTEEEKENVFQFTSLDVTSLQHNLEGAFTNMELSIIRYSLQEPIQKWERQQIYIIGGNQLTVDNINLLVGCQETLSSMVKNFIPLQNENESELNVYSREPMFMLLHLFYLSLKDKYCPLIKRYLMAICNILQKQIFQVNSTPIYLRGALKIIEQASINPTNFANKLARLRPIRSEHFEQPHLSSKVKNQFQFVQSVSQDLANYLRIAQVEQGWQKEEIPELTIEKMNYSGKTKIVNFAISGFLSQDTAKDIEWMGLIRALPDCELYGVTWKSSTVKEMGAYIGKLCGEGLLNPLAYSFGLVGKIGTMASVGMKIYNEYKSNPFAQAHHRAEITGRYLAELIIAHFSDRFVNLIGFSLGTEVVLSCLQRLTERNRLYLINRVVTMGAVISQDKVKQFLESISTPISWINLKSDKDHAVKYIYRFYSLGTKPIGAEGLPICGGHNLSNLEVGTFIKGHMDFRCYLYGIAHITELIHD